MSMIYDWIVRGTRAAQTAAAVANKGMLYFVTDESKLERSSGSAWETMSAAAGSGWVLLETRSAAAGVDIQFTTRNAPGKSGATFQNDFDEYVIVGSVFPATNGASLLQQIGEGATPTWNAATSYQVAGIGFASGGFQINDSGSGLTANRLLNSLSNTANWYANFTITWFGLRVAAAVKSYTGTAIFFNSTPAFVQQTIGGHLVSSAVATAIKFFASAGNITGTIKVYGVTK